MERRMKDRQEKNGKGMVSTGRGTMTMGKIDSKEGDRGDQGRRQG
jgi:hypothetical protein